MKIGKVNHDSMQFKLYILNRYENVKIVYKTKCLLQEAELK